ncbi:3810_t:CDS:1, partial [Gigaspora rosea]
ITTKYGNSDHQLEEGILDFSNNTSLSSVWKYNRKQMSNQFIKTEIAAELKDIKGEH